MIVDMIQANSIFPSGKSPLPKIALTVQYASRAKNLPARTQLRRWIKAALRQDAHITVRIVDEMEGRELNKNYRGKDYATNVLTFVYDDFKPSTLSGVHHGDVVICAPVVEREASAQHKEPMAHYAHLTIHAMLHIQGYAHEDEADAAEMEALEIALMLKLRYPDPYQAQ